MQKSVKFISSLDFFYLPTILLFSVLFTNLSAMAQNSMEAYRTKIGIGMSNQLMSNTASISLKLQKSRGFAISGMAGANTSDEGGYGVGMKAYRIIFEEPQLNFYSALMGAILSQKTAGKSTSGFQFDLTLGTEFSFSGLNSLGFSLEFGVSAYKLDDFVLSTVGNNMINAAVHFYL